MVKVRVDNDFYSLKCLESMLDRVEVCRWENVDLFLTNTDDTDVDEGDGGAASEARLDSVAVAKRHGQNQPLRPLLPPPLLLL